MGNGNPRAVSVLDYALTSQELAMDPAARTILALDLGKYKSRASLSAGDPAPARFGPGQSLDW
jgi:hypothetical protein